MSSHLAAAVATRPRGLVARALHWLVRVYRAVTAGRPSPCRYDPTCSAFALEALEHHGAVRGTWGVTDNNRKARYYAITAAGKKLLAAERSEWDRMVGIMQAILSEPS